MKAFYIIAFFILASLAACQKKDETPPQPSKVVTDVYSPQEGQVFRMGDTVHISGKISYISQLHGYTLKITDARTARILYTDSEHAHTDNFSVNTFWVNTLPEAADLKLVIETQIDHEDNNAVKEVGFRSQP